MKSFLFKELMFSQILAGNKTQTRRIVRTKQAHCHLEFVSFEDGYAYFYDLQTGSTEVVNAPKKVGDICYLKEPYCFAIDGITVLYAFNYETEKSVLKYKNKLFMPEKYARFFVKVIGVGVEELQHIGLEDAIKEGIEIVEYVNDVPIFTDYLYDFHRGYSNPVSSFRSLWQSIHKKEPNRWEDNPFVWVYDFELTKNPSK